MRAVPLVSLFAAAISGSAVAQSACGVSPAVPYLQQSALQPVSPTIPLMPQLPTARGLALPQLLQVPSFSASPSTPSNLSPSGTGGLMLPSTPSNPGTQALNGVGGLTTPYAPSAPGGTGGLPAGINSSATTIKEVLNDSFANGIDPSKWGVNYPWGMIPNDPTQYAAYATSLSSDVFSTGANGLSIAIKPTSLDGKPAETGQIHSTQSFKPGTYIEMTATLPTTPGVGAAFWMMPVDGSGTYSELDMMESLGQDPNTVYSTVHDGSGQQQAPATVPAGVQSPHTYGVDWETDTTTFYVDGKPTRSFATPASMQKPMYAILSMNSTPPNSPSPWGQAVNGSTQLPASFNVQNVRAYCLSNCN